MKHEGKERPDHLQMEEENNYKERGVVNSHPSRSIASDSAILASNALTSNIGSPVLRSIANAPIDRQSPQKLIVPRILEIDQTQAILSGSLATSECEESP